MDRWAVCEVYEVWADGWAEGEVYEVWADRWAEGWIKPKGFIKTKSLKGGV